MNLPATPGAATRDSLALIGPIDKPVEEHVSKKEIDQNAEQATSSEPEAIGTPAETRTVQPDGSEPVPGVLEGFGVVVNQSV